MFGAFIVSWGIWFGFVPREGAVMYCGKDLLEYERPGTVAGLSLSVETGRFTVFTDMESFQIPREMEGFTPYRIDYTIGASVRVTKNVDLVVNHECDHPVTSSNKEEGPFLLTTVTKAYVLIHGKGEL